MTSNPERTRMLDEAEELLRKAEELIRRAVAGTDLVPIGDRLCRSVSDAVTSDDASIRCLRRNIEYADKEHPIWTKPLVSVKNIDRRDI